MADNTTAGIDPADKQIQQVDKAAEIIEVSAHEFRRLINQVEELHSIITEFHGFIQTAASGGGMPGMLLKNFGG